jgi:hypothetical protein
MPTTSQITSLIRKRQKTSAARKVWSEALKSSFGWRGTPTGETMTVSFKSRGPPLEEVVTVLRHHITGNGGMNLLLTKWVDDLTAGAIQVIEEAGERVSILMFQFPVPSFCL